MPPAAARIKVRVQARDGKILGPAATVRQPLLTVRNVVTGEVLINDAPINQSSSGTVVPASQFSNNVSRNAIVVQPPTINSPSYPSPGPYWLETPSDQGELIVSLAITEPALLEFRATAYSPDPVFASATMWVMPYMQLLDDPGLVLTIAGLYATVKASEVNRNVSISANITMMCGCPITVQPSQTLPQDTEPFWPSNEFDVTAQLRASGGQQVIAFPLTSTSTSTFTGTSKVPPGTYDVWVVAVQAQESNVGFARTTLKVM